MTAFSNNFEFESWSPNWCGRCSKDGVDQPPFCPILNVAFLENTVPAEWSAGTDDLRDRYHCSEFDPYVM